MIKGLVSVIIPTYNRAAYLIEALESAKAQTYPLKQIVIVDDGSSDETAARMSELKDVEYHRQERRGQGAARNYGLQFARGEYIASLDSDDLWDPDFLSYSVECIEAHGLDFVFTNWTKVRNGQMHQSEWLRDLKWRAYRARLDGEWSLMEAAEVRRLFLKICPAPSSSLLIRSSSIGSGWGEHMLIADEWHMLLDMVLQHPTRAAFSLTPRWKKRVDGKNVYDGRPYAEAAKQLHLHDYVVFRKDFKSLLTRREKFTLALRERMFRLRLLLHQMSRTNLAVRLRVPRAVASLRSLKHASLFAGQDRASPVIRDE
jgi:glycosyltransferase involved in cell wall biosynthesis